MKKRLTEFGEVPRIVELQDATEGFDPSSVASISRLPGKFGCVGQGGRLRSIMGEMTITVEPLL
jgi:hypothetical protein